MLPPFPVNGVVLTVRNQLGVPIPDMCVTLGNFFGVFAQGRTHALGTVVLSTEGQYAEVYINVRDCSARKPGYTGGGETILMRENQAPTGLVIRAYSSKLSGGVQGRVVDSTGAGIANAYFPDWQVSTDADGIFLLWNVGEVAKFFVQTQDRGGMFCDPVVNVPSGTLVKGVVLTCGD